MMKLLPFLSLLLSARLVDAAPPPVPAGLGPPPGVVIDTTPLPDTEYVGSPGIAILPDGTYVASHDFFGKEGEELRGTRVFRSTDHGATWTPAAHLPEAAWGALFTHRGALYLQAIAGEYRDLVLLRSNDGGRTWTKPTDAKHGRLFKGRFHSAPVPVIEHAGRIWRAVEEAVNDQPWPRNFASLVVSAPANADLLDAANWTRTNSVNFDPTWVPGRRPGWLEGNIVAGPDGRLVNILRVNAEIDATSDFALHTPAAGIPRYEVAARIDIAADGATARFDPMHGFFHLPGSQSKFTIRFDPQSRRYWSLINKITLLHEDRDDRVSPIAQRNVVALISSADLLNWREHGVVLRWREGEKLTRQDRFAFQYLDWQFDGADLVAVARTAWGAQSFHNANLLTFHRVKNFRELAH